MKTYIRETLPNGVRICAVPRPGTESVSIVVVVKSGSEFEPPRLAGITHLLEHVCFRGTDTYPTQKAIVRILDTMGPHTNAITTSEDMRFFQKVSASDDLQALDILFEIVARPLMRKEDVEIEKGPVRDEIQTALSLPFELREMLLTGSLYGDQVSGRDVAGTVESVQGIDVTDVQKYHRQICVGSNVVVLLVGKVEGRLLEAAKEKFGKIPGGIPPKKIRVKEVFKGPVWKFDYHQGKQVFLSFTVKTVNYFDEMVLPLQVLATALGGMMSSLLFEELRIERGLVYDVGASNSFFTDRGYLEVTSEVDPENIEQVIEILIRHLGRAEAVHEKYLDGAKNNLMRRVDSAFEDSFAAAQVFADREAYGLSFLTPRKIKERIAFVTHDDVRAAASLIFRPERFYVVGVGPIRSERRLTKIGEMVARAFK